LPIDFGDYELLEEIAHGGMGVVYKARQKSLDRLVAVKMILAGQFAAKQFVQRFRAEAAAAAVLQHPNIVAIHEVGIHEGQHFFSMDYVEGQNLAHLVGQRPLPPTQAAKYVKLIAEAIHYAHEQGILHRDLKPSNVLIDSATDQPRITDFGLAKRLDGESSLTMTGQVLGSPNFMPPEQAGGSRGKVGRQSDVYGLGAILYYLLTARAPFQAESLQTIVTQVLNTEPLSPQLLNPAVRPDLETICLKCLEKEPARRFKNAQEVGDELGRFLGGEPIHARPISQPERIWRWCRRKPAIASLVVALQVALALGVTGVFWQWRRAEQHAASEARERQRAEAGERNARQHQYVADMNLVKQVWEEGNLKRATNLLRAYIPKQGEADLRGFEWRYLWNLCQDESLLTIRCEADDPVWHLVTSSNHAFVAACCDRSIRLLDPATGKELQKFSYAQAATNTEWNLLALASNATNLLAAHGAKGFVGLWDLASGVLQMTFRPFTNELGTLALSPDGTRLAAGEHRRYGSMLTLWDISSRRSAPRLLWSRPLDAGFTVLRFSPDGQTLVANGKSFTAGTIVAVDTKTGLELEPFPQQSVGSLNDLAFSPDGRLLASSGVQGRINVWDFTNRTVASFFEGNYGRVSSLAFSGDGLRLAAGCDDGTIRIWDVASGMSLGLLRDPQDREIRTIVFAPDSKSIISIAEDELKIWKAAPRQPAVTMETHQEWGGPPVFSPDGKWLVTSGATNWERGPTGSTCAGIWELPSRQKRFELVLKQAEALAAAFSPDAKLFVLGQGHSNVLHVWETRQWEKASTPPEALVNLTNDFETGSIAFSPDGAIMATAGLYFPLESARATNRLAFWQVGSWRKLGILRDAEIGATAHEAAATVAFSNDGRLLAVGHRDGAVRLWDFKEQHLLKEWNEQKGPAAGYGVNVKFSGDGRWLASVALSGENLALYDLKDAAGPRLALLTKAHPGGEWSATFAPDNRSLVTSGGDGLIRFWNLETLTVALTLEHSCGPGVFVALFRDGTLLASQDALGTVKLWPAPAFREIRETERR
jgi:WD40 repeat protein/tRNA A-37 threonylcarbamoyl transferase component Bud32